MCTLIANPHPCAPLTLGSACMTGLCASLDPEVIFTHSECNGMYLCIMRKNTTFNNGSLGSRTDEERSEMR
jgi:hypothetical protein